jgi:hypothetical protein
MSSESTRYLNRPVDDELNQDHISWLTNNMKPDAKLRFASYTLSMASAASSGDPTCQTACRACLDFANSQVPIVSEKVKADMQSNNTNPPDSDVRSGFKTLTTMPPTDSSTQK